MELCAKRTFSAALACNQQKQSKIWNDPYRKSWIILSWILKIDHFIDKPKGLLEPAQANIYQFKVNNRKTRNRCEICSKLTIRSLMSVSKSSLLTLNIFHAFFWCFCCSSWTGKCLLEYTIFRGIVK